MHDLIPLVYQANDLEVIPQKSAHISIIGQIVPLDKLIRNQTHDLSPIDEGGFFKEKPMNKKSKRK
ncbi:hypothetical protein DL897_13480 [Thermoflavimicrobium daqui]|uniref:Uncharacterized protein n=1 Tax=Thermoflavimicrobium daqui TaxID=2137476 RepID=A0A364K2M7_9BACL|nr:hypothetical protein DL897_13480 [Thermoflavimicrobium daqui]